MMVILMGVRVNVLQVSLATILKKATVILLRVRVLMSVMSGLMLVMSLLKCLVETGLLLR